MRLSLFKDIDQWGNLTEGDRKISSMVYRPYRYEQIMCAAESLDVRARRMFGGMGVFTGERMFAFLIGEEIGLKLSPEDRDEAMQMPGAGTISSQPDAEPMQGYVRMPHEVLDDTEQFSSWVERSAEYAKRKAAHQA